MVIIITVRVKRIGVFFFVIRLYNIVMFNLIKYVFQLSTSLHLITK